MPGGPGVSKRAPKFELGCCPALRHGQLRARVEDLSTGGKSQELVQQLAELDAKYQDLEGRYAVANAARSGLARQCGLLEEENARLEESLLGDSGLSFQGPVVTIDLLVSLFEILDHRQFQRAVLVVVITSHTIVMNHGDKS